MPALSSLNSDYGGCTHAASLIFLPESVLAASPLVVLLGCSPLNPFQTVCPPPVEPPDLDTPRAVLLRAASLGRASGDPAASSSFPPPPPPPPPQFQLLTPGSLSANPASSCRFIAFEFSAQHIRGRDSHQEEGRSRWIEANDLHLLPGAQDFVSLSSPP